jgi:hypothetical protein
MINNPDADLVWLDFGEVFREAGPPPPEAPYLRTRGPAVSGANQPEQPLAVQQALAAFQSLLLDEASCRARVDLLHALRDRATREMPDLVPPRADFTREIRAIAELGTFRAFAQGLLLPHRLAGLTRDPDALWQAHLALLRAGQTPIGPASD